MYHNAGYVLTPQVYSGEAGNRISHSASGEGEMERTDISLLLITLILVGLGTVMVYSSSSVLAQVKFGSSSFFLKRHLLRASAGVALMLLMMRVNYKFWAKISKPLPLLGFTLLLVVLFQKFTGSGSQVRGAYRWIRLSWISFQPSELMKVILVLYIADYLVRRQDQIHDFSRGFLPQFLIVSSALGLIALQPDLGTAVVISLIVGILLFVGRAKLSHLVGVALGVLAILCVLIYGAGYGRERIEAFLHRGDDMQGASYQINQSLLGLGNGGVLGVGLGGSEQKLFFLPEPHTDFIFSIIGEELGLLGTLTVLILFLLFARSAIRIAKKAPDLHGFLFAVGITTMILVCAGVNISVAMGVLPTTGLPLPLISYGGSSLLLTLGSTGILLNIYRQAQAGSGNTRWR